MFLRRKPAEPSSTISTGTPDASGYFPIAEKSDGAVAESRPLEFPPSSEKPQIEICVVRKEYQTSPTFEVWTERTVYEFDRSLCCTAARDSKTGEAKTHHDCVGTRLLGGRRFRDQVIDMSAPMPGVGYNALLGGDERSTIVTSPVMRVVMYVWQWSSLPRRASVGPDGTRSSE